MHTPTTEIYTLSLHDALPISDVVEKMRSLPNSPTYSSHNSPNDLAHAEIFVAHAVLFRPSLQIRLMYCLFDVAVLRSEEHTSELQSLAYLVCRLLLEKKN